MLSLDFKVKIGAVANDNKHIIGRDRPTTAQREWLRRGLDQPGGKLPLFDRDGRRMPVGLIRACIAQGWAEPWFRNPLKPDWLICKITADGRRLIAG